MRPSPTPHPLRLRTCLRAAALPRAGRRRRSRAGTTLVEVLIAATLLAIAMGGLVASTLTSRVQMRGNRETATAIEAARRMLEEVRARPFDEIYAAYDDTDADDALVTGTAPGPGFAVFGLDARPDDPDGLVGRVLLPGAGGVLREDAAEPLFGLPRDLDGDGAIDAADHATDYAFLPVVVRVEWRGVRGDRSLELTTCLWER